MVAASGFAKYIRTKIKLIRVESIKNYFFAGSAAGEISILSNLKIKHLESFSMNAEFCLIRDFFHSRFCPIWDFAIRDFVQFRILSVWDFFHSEFCPIRDFVHSEFFPIQDFPRSGFCTASVQTAITQLSSYLTCFMCAFVVYLLKAY